MTQIESLRIARLSGTTGLCWNQRKLLVDKSYRLDLSISYDQAMQISADLENSVCAQCEADGVVTVSLSKLKKSLFATGSVDNIDHNPSSSTARLISQNSDFSHRAPYQWLWQHRQKLSSNKCWPTKKENRVKRPILAFNLIWIILFQLGVLLTNRSQMSSLETWNVSTSSSIRSTSY